MIKIIAGGLALVLIAGRLAPSQALELPRRFAAAEKALEVQFAKHSVPRARPVSSTRIRAATALEMISRLPVSRANGIRCCADEKREAVRHPSPHAPQWWQARKPR